MVGVKSWLGKGTLDFGVPMGTQSLFLSEVSRRPEGAKGPLPQGFSVLCVLGWEWNLICLLPTSFEVKLLPWEEAEGQTGPWKNA